MNNAARVFVIFLGFCALSSVGLLAGRASNPAIDELTRLEAAGSRPMIAIIGDSRAHTGISPERLVHELASRSLPPVTAHNFAVDGTDVLHHFSVVNNWAKASPAFPAVVVWTPNPLQFDATRENNRLEQLPLSDLAPLAQAGAPKELLLDVLTMNAFPAWRQRPLVALKISDYAERLGKRTLPIQTSLLGLTYTPEVRSREYTPLPDGQVPFVVLDWKSRFERGAKNYIAEYARLVPSEWHLNMGRQLARKVRQAGGILIILEMPVSPWFQRNLLSHPKHLAWRAALEQIAREEGALYWNHSEVFRAENDDLRFGDPGHMARDLAAEYTAHLGLALATDPMISPILKDQKLADERRLGTRDAL